MKILIPFSLLVIGLAIGYAVGINTTEIVKETYTLSDSISVKPKIIHDTIVKTKIVEVEKQVMVKAEVDTLIEDSLDLDSVFVDTIDRHVTESFKDTVKEENLNILSDNRLKIIKMSVKHLDGDVNESDSLLKSTIDISAIDNKFINVEFWESPIGFSGYKLSKSKLIVYGLSPQLEYQIYKRKRIYFLSFHSITYEMFETEEFKQFVQTSNPLK